MTPQEIFDKIVNGLRIQGQKSENKNKTCRYRTKVNNEGRPEPDSLKCAVGLLIEDSEYDPCMESLTVRAIINEEFCPPALAARIEPHIAMITALAEGA